VLGQQLDEERTDAREKEANLRKTSTDQMAQVGFTKKADCSFVQMIDIRTILEAITNNTACLDCF
jgi:hypothetical protein